MGFLILLKMTSYLIMTQQIKIKMNHIKTMLCGHFIGIDKLERLKLLQNDPLVNEFDKGPGVC